MNTTNAVTIKSLNDRLYRAARKAGFEQALSYAHVEVTSWGADEPYITWNHDHEPSDDVAPLDMTAIKRAEAWLAKALAAASPWEITITFSEAGDGFTGTFGTFGQVDRVLRKIQTVASPGGAYEKTYFEVKHSSGEEYTGRIDVQDMNYPAPSLRAHMLQHCAYLLSSDAAKLLSGATLTEAREAGKLWTELLSCDHPSNADELALAASEMKRAS